MARNINFLRYDVEQNCLRFIELMAAEGHPVLVTCTTRTDAEQYQLFLDGYSNAETPSFHAEHAGLAFDICKNVKGQEYSDNAFWEAAGRIGKAMGFTWGGDWKSIVDKPHFQWDDGGKYTGAMVRNKEYPPPMPLFAGEVSVPAERPLLRRGSTGSDVVALQTLLNSLGYPCGTADGIFGAKTEAAVRAFQKANKLLVDGIVGKQTWAALYTDGTPQISYYVIDGIHICEVDVKDFAIDMCNDRKKTAHSGNYCNAGFFGTFREGNTYFTLPVGHLVCDFSATESLVRKYCTERGRFLTPSKYQFDVTRWGYDDKLSGNAISTLLVANGKAKIEDVKTLPDGLDYAISGVPIMRGGQDVKFNSYVRGQGWDGSTLYGTWHVFLGLKQNDNKIYVMGMRTTTSNMILSAEAYRKFRDIGMHDVIKLDGGGSFHFDVNGQPVASTSENRLINTIIKFKR